MSELNGLENPRLQIIQLLNGEDIATEETAQAMPEAARAQKIAVHKGAAQSANFIYLIIDRETKDCACVDAAWDTTGLLRVTQALELNLIAALYTHRHVDHTGGIYQEGIRLEGLSNLALAGVSAFLGAADVEATLKACSLGTMTPQIVGLYDGDIIPIGGLKVKAMLTPGHTSGGVCFACGGDVEEDANIEAVITGDTLFVGAFGNLEDQDTAPAQMYDSLKRLGALPDMVAVLPGHNYGDERMSRIVSERTANVGMRCETVAQFRIIAGVDEPPEGMRVVDLPTPGVPGKLQGDNPEQRALAAAAAEPGAVQTATGLVYLETQAGDGVAPVGADTVEVHYEGRLIDGTVFDSSIARGPETISFPLSAVIAGWTEGLQLMTANGKARLTIPSELGYGVSGSPPAIPGGVTLVFDVELISVKSASGVSSGGAAGTSSGWLLPTPPTGPNFCPNLFQKFNPEIAAASSSGVIVVCPCAQIIRPADLARAEISPLWCRVSDDWTHHAFVAPRL